MLFGPDGGPLSTYQHKTDKPGPDSIAIISLVVAFFSLLLAFFAYNVARRTYLIDATPTITLSCALRNTELGRLPFSDVDVFMGSVMNYPHSQWQVDFSDSLTTKRVVPNTIDLMSNQAQANCTLHSFSHLPLINVSVRLPILIADSAVAVDGANYLVCLEPIASISPDGEFKFTLLNGSKNSEILRAPLPAKATVPSLGRVDVPLIVVDQADQFKDMSEMVLPVSDDMKGMQSEPIPSSEDRLGCARVEDREFEPTSEPPVESLLQKLLRLY